MGADQEGVLADVEFHAGVQRQHDDLARRVTEKATRPGPCAMLRMCGMPPSVRFMPPPVFIAAIGTRGFLPQHHVMLEEDGIAWR